MGGEVPRRPNPAGPAGEGEGARGRIDPRRRNHRHPRPSPGSWPYRRIHPGRRLRVHTFSATTSTMLMPLMISA